MGKTLFKWTSAKVNQLITYVKEYKAIYDEKHEFHRDRVYVDNIWRKIDYALEMPPGFAKDQWQRIRIRFRKEFNHTDGSESKWLFYDKLKFIIPHLKCVNRDGSHEKFVKRICEKLGASCSGNEQEILTLETSQVAEADESDIEHGEIFLISDAGADDNEYINSEYEYEIYNQNSSDNIIHEAEVDEIIEEVTENYSDHDSAEEQLPSNVKPTVTKTLKRKVEIISSIASTTKEQLIPTKIVKHSPVAAAEQEILPPAPTPQPIQMIIPSVASSSVPAISTPPPPSTPTIGCLCQNDADAIFLRSLLDDIKSMSRKNKGLFKIRVQQAIQDILYSEDDS